MVTIDEGFPQQVGPTSWLYQFTSDQPFPTFIVLRGGKRIKTFRGDPSTGKGSYLATVRNGESPLIGIRDGTETILPAAETAIALRWPTIAGSTGYRVEQYISGAWRTVGSLKARGGTHEQFRTQNIADATATQFRVTAIGQAGILGTASTITATISRHPDPPAVAYTYDPVTDTVTVAAAA